MKLQTRHLGLQITIDDDLLNLLEREARRFYPNEYGGILIGKYSEDQMNVVISETILSVAKNLSQSKFERSVDLAKLVTFYNQFPKLIYIGEWHSHPNASCNPSITDLKAMFEIATHEEVLIENPILLIISIYEKSFDFRFYVYCEEKIYQYEESNN